MTDYNKIEKAKQIVEKLISFLDPEASVDYEESITKGLVFNVSSRESYMLIGRQGSSLHALTVLAQALVFKELQSQEPFWFTIDVDDYKRKREWFIKETARGAAEQLKRTGRPQALEPMPSYERRLVHAYLQEHCPDLESSSVGEDPYRKVVIRLKN